MGALASAISNAAGQGLGFDVFQIRQEPTRGLTLTAGRYLGSRLFLDLQLPLGSQSQQTTAGRQSRAGIRAGVHAAPLAPGQPPGRQPVARASVPGAPCVLADRRGPLALLACPELERRSRAQDALNRVGPNTQVHSVEFQFKGKHVAGPGRAAAEDRADGPGRHGRAPARASDSCRSCRRWARTRSIPSRCSATWSGSGATTSARGFPRPTSSTRRATRRSRTHRGDLRDRRRAAARGRHAGVRRRAAARSRCRRRSSESWRRFVRAERDRARPGRRGRAPGAGRQHRALVPGPRLSVRVRASARAGGQRRQSRRAQRAGGSRSPGKGAADRGRPGTRRFPRGRSCASSRSAGRLVRRPRRRTGAPGSSRSMDIMRLAIVDVPRDSADDSSVVVMLRITESQKHLISGEAGFISSGGLTSQATWTDRSWLGGLRTLTVAATGADRHRRAGESGAASSTGSTSPHSSRTSGTGTSRWRAAPSSSTGATSGTGARRSGSRARWSGRRRRSARCRLATRSLIAGSTTTASARTSRPRNTCPSSASPLRERPGHWTSPATGAPSRSRGAMAGWTGSPTRERDT